MDDGLVSAPTVHEAVAEKKKADIEQGGLVCRAPQDTCITAKCQQHHSPNSAGARKCSYLYPDKKVTCQIQLFQKKTP